MLDDVKTAFNIEKSQQGLLQTVFVISYMIFAPIFGYMGDRYSRRVIMSFGVLLWSVTTLAGSFMVKFLAPGFSILAAMLAKKCKVI